MPMVRGRGKASRRQGSSFQAIENEYLLIGDLRTYLNYSKVLWVPVQFFEIALFRMGSHGRGWGSRPDRN